MHPLEKILLVSGLYIVLNLVWFQNNQVHAENNVQYQQILEDAKNYQDSFIRPKYIPFPNDNPYNADKIELGKKLFFDTALTIDRSRSCATCHIEAKGFTDGLQKATDLKGLSLKRKTPTLYNLAWDKHFFWDGRAKSLEEQILETLSNPQEMGMPPALLNQRLQENSDYIPIFQKSFANEPNPVNATNAIKALANFVRMQVSPLTKFDNWLAGNDNALTQDELEGFILFNTKANCTACHIGWRFTDDIFNDIGIQDNDLGRGNIEPNNITMKHAFKTSGLRKVNIRSPFMHNGSLQTLEDVIDHYNNGNLMRNDELDERVNNDAFSIPVFSQPLNLTDEEKRKLTEFLNTL